MIDAQADEILSFKKVLWKPAESTERAFHALANRISYRVYRDS